MGRVNSVKTSFTGGEIAPELVGRADLRAYENGASRLCNVFVSPTGGVYRRPGLRYVDGVDGTGRLVAFEFNTVQVYLLYFADETLTVYRDGAAQASIAAPWTGDQLSQLYWTQSADTLLVVHPDVAPKKITRTSHTDWTIDDWAYVDDEDSGRRYLPTHKFADDAVTLTPSGTTGSITLTASAAVFVSDHVNTRFRVGNKEVEVTAVASGTSATATVKEDLAGTEATKDWEEQAFSAHRGWPVSCCFHQDRLVIGGSRELPNRLWLSKSSDLFNFDLAEGLDDEGIEFALLSDQVNAIRGVFSGRHLQIFTSGAEWMATGAPLTPASIQLNRQTRVGSPIDRTVLPQSIDGATLFAPRVGKGLFEYLYTDVEQAYQAANVATLAHHLVNAPVEMDYDPKERLLHVVMQDGSLATLTAFRAEKVTAWTSQETEGLFRSVAQTGEETYFLIERDGAFSIEVLDEALSVDAGLAGTDDPATDTWSGLDHLDGRTVTIVGDGSVLSERVVESGQVVLERAVSETVIGLAFTHEIKPMPPGVTELGAGVQGGRFRLVTATFRLKDTHTLYVDAGRGLISVPFQRMGANLLDQPLQAFSGDKRIRAYGWHRDGTTPLWRISQSTPLPFNLLSVVAEVAANV